jgi:hypothetical protein
MNLNSAGFVCLRNMFPRISFAKNKEGVFGVWCLVFGVCWPSNKRVNKRCKIRRPAEKAARNLINKFWWGNHKAEICRDMLGDPVQPYKAKGVM